MKGEVIYMDKSTVLEIAFETIKESTEWAMECDDKNYNYWITGVVAMTDKFLDKFNKKNCKENDD